MRNCRVFSYCLFDILDVISLLTGLSSLFELTASKFRIKFGLPTKKYIIPSVLYSETYPVLIFLPFIYFLSFPCFLSCQCIIGTGIK